MLSAPTRRHRGFTLIELIVVVVIMGILVAVGAFAYNAVLGSARDSADRAHAEQVSRDIRGAVAVRNLDLSELVANVPAGSTASAVSADIRNKLGLDESDQFVTPLPRVAPFPARLQVRDGTSYSCVVIGSTATTPGPCPLLLNPGFEGPVSGSADGADYVRRYYNADLTRDTSQSHSGEASLRVDLTSTATTSGVVFLPLRGLLMREGTTLRAGAWVKAPDGVRFHIGGRRLDAAYGWLSEGLGRTEFVGTGQWQYVQTSSWTATGSAYEGLQIVSMSPAPGQTLWVDDVELAVR